MIQKEWSPLTPIEAEEQLHPIVVEIYKDITEQYEGLKDVLDRYVESFADNSKKNNFGSLQNDVSQISATMGRMNATRRIAVRLSNISEDFKSRDPEEIAQQEFQVELERMIVGISMNLTGMMDDTYSGRGSDMARSYNEGASRIARVLLMKSLKVYF